jgi:5-methyltetrahydrofolate--homocysteine methyltransferase
MDILQEIVEATVKGDTERCVALAQQALNQEIDPLDIIQNGYARGMHIIGEQFARLDCFLPEVMMAADAMKAAIDILRPTLLQKGDAVSQGKVVIATIQGDLHDLGKNIVCIMLEAAGFTVYDLGADVRVRELVDQAEEVGADIIAASAILTTTMSHMPDIARILTELGIRDKYRIMLGGAPVIAEWAEGIGADGYGEDAVEAVEVAKQLMEKKRGGAEK